jgi:hypothetical protein
MHHPEITNNFNTDIVHSPFNEFLNIGVTLGILGNYNCTSVNNCGIFWQEMCDGYCA